MNVLVSRGCHVTNITRKGLLLYDNSSYILLNILGYIYCDSPNFAC